MGCESVKAEIGTDLVPSHVTAPVEVAQGATVRSREDEIIGRSTLNPSFQHFRHGARDRDLPCFLGLRGCSVQPAAYFRGALDHRQPVRGQVDVADAKRREF
jgi:hypothetical protein